MATDRRRFLTLLGAGAAGAAVGVPTLEAATAAEFRDMGADGRAVALNEARRAYLGRVHPFFEVAPPVSQVDYGLAKAASISDDGVDRPFQYAIPVTASGDGANQSVWKTRVTGRVESDNQADIRARLTPRGRASTPDDPITSPVLVDGRGAIRWDDPLLNLFGASGTGWMLIESSEPLSFSDSYTFNQAADGSQQGQGIPVFDLEGIMDDARIAHAGDVQRFELYGTPDVTELEKRENWLMWQPDGVGTARLDYWIENSDGTQMTTTRTVELEAGEYLQQNGLHDNFPDYLVQPGDSLVVRVFSADHEQEVAVYQAVSHADNIKPESQDPMTNEGHISRGIESVSLRVNSGEQNDPVVYQALIRAGPEAVVESVYIDWNGDGTFSEQYNDINQRDFSLEKTGAHNEAPDTYAPRMRVFFANRRTGSVSRDFTGEEYTVAAEENEHSVEMTQEVKDRLADSETMDALTGILYRGYVVNPQDPSVANLKTADEWAALLADRIDGNPDNHELSSISFYRTPRSVGFNDWFNTGVTLQLNGFCKQTQREMYSILTGGERW